jgi:hypothetical protein
VGDERQMAKVDANEKPEPVLYANMPIIIFRTILLRNIPIIRN